ncbi:RNA polymerase sigma factor [Archangium lipolyticum]|uniref:RNA polymerase sigma factor n=1 Tax=Archangium lipolyticum TaxID=2970465 RepID=UPI002149C2AD|nr:RNA polymerase sigma factor [Archangium lipolyticum]
MNSICVSSQPTVAVLPGVLGFHGLVQQHERALHAVALRLCGNAADARDLVQDTFERALRHFDRFQEGTNGRAWLFTILRHCFISRCRSRTCERRSDVSVEDMQEHLAAPEAEPLQAWAAFSLEQIHAALERLPVEFSEVYRLHSLEGRSYEEIARQLRIPKATVGTRLIRARRKLRDLLMPPQVEEGGMGSRGTGWSEGRAQLPV